jgi:hypothetical protein
MAAGSPRSRPVGGWIGPAATATGDGLDVGVAVGAATTVGVTPGCGTVLPALGTGAADGVRNVGGVVDDGVGATCGPLLELDTLGLGLGAGEDDVEVGEADGDGNAPTVMLPCAEPAPLSAVTLCAPEAVAW